MQIVYEHWKYIVKHIWFILPFAVIPALFLSLSMDFSAIEAFWRGLFSGDFVTDWFEIFCAWSLFGFGSVLDIIYAVCGIVCTLVFMSLILAFVEKHMRIGKRTLSGILSQLSGVFPPVCGMMLVIFFFYEVWALVLSAMLYSIVSVGSAGGIIALSLLVVLFFLAVLLYLVSLVYLCLPCMQMTGLGPFQSLLYSYRLMVGVRGKLLLCLLMSFEPAGLIVWGASFLPEAASVLICLVLFTFLFMSFCVRMETFYFETDKLDREDLLLSYREL